MRPQKVIVLGATGTIGRRTLDVVKQLQQADPSWECVGLACGTRIDQVLEESQNFWPHAKTASVVEDDRTDYCGEDAALQLVEACASSETIVVSAIVGAAGLRPTLRAIELGASVALANKETLVCAGHFGSAGASVFPRDIVARGFRARGNCPMLARRSFRTNQVDCVDRFRRSVPRHLSGRSSESDSAASAEPSGMGHGAPNHHRQCHHGQQGVGIGRGSPPLWRHGPAA